MSQSRQVSDGVGMVGGWTRASLTFISATLFGGKRGRRMGDFGGIIGFYSDGFVLPSPKKVQERTGEGCNQLSGLSR